MTDDRTWFAMGLLIVALLASGVVLPGTTPPDPDDPDDPVSTVDLRDGGDYLWPYTSKAQTADRRTLGINLVVYAPPDRVRRVMTDRSVVDWEPTLRNETEANAETHSVDRIAVDGDRVVWREARGATRYTYVSSNASVPHSPTDTDGRWLSEYDQVHDGAYLGARDHVRLYGTDGGSWTALQAHSEHWDWFRLRHSVSGTADARRRVEADFMAAPSVEQVSRRYVGNEDVADGDGWVSLVEFVDGERTAAGALSVLVALPVGVRRLRERLGGDDARRVAVSLALPATPVALYLGVRLAGVAFEGLLPGVSPKLFAGVLYPAVAVGLPVAVYLLAGRHPPGSAFALAFVALAVAFVVDYALLGVSVVSLRTVCYRVAVLASLALVAAAGASNRDRAITTLGVACWVATLVTPLYGAL